MARPQRAHPEEAASSSAGVLDERDRALLDFERRWTSRSGGKSAAIRAEFGFSPARYYQLLYALIERPAALREDPLLVRRLERLRDSRVRARQARTFGPDAASSQDDTD